MYTLMIISVDVFQYFVHCWLRIRRTDETSMRELRPPVNAAESGWDSACFCCEWTYQGLHMSGRQPPTIKQGDSHSCCSNHFFKRLTSPFVKPLSWCWNHSCWHSDLNSELLNFHVWWSTPKNRCASSKSLCCAATQDWWIASKSIWAHRRPSSDFPPPQQVPEGKGLTSWRI